MWRRGSALVWGTRGREFETPRPDVKLKDSKTCFCWRWNRDTPEGIRGSCRAGYCTNIRCPYCGLLIAEWGPITCPHKKDVPRYFRHPDMSTKTHVAVKENTMRKQKRSHKR